MSIYLLQTINGIGIGMLYFLLAVGLSIVFGLLRFVNFAHGTFYLLGAYFCYQMAKWGLSFWLSLVVVPLAVGAIGWLTEKLVLRHVYAKPHEFHILVTVGFALVVQEVVILLWGPLGDSVGVPELLNGVVMWGGLVYPKYRLFVIGFTAVLAVVIWWVLEGTRLGSVVRAGSESTEMVSLLGTNVFGVFSLVFGLGVGLAALAGVLAAPVYQVTPLMGQNLIIVVFAVVVIGGMGSIMGSIFTGLGLGVIEGLTKVFWPEASSTVVFFIMVIVLLLRPAGLFGKEK